MNEVSETVSQKKPFLFLCCLCQAFCHSLACTHTCWALSQRTKLVSLHLAVMVVSHESQQLKKLRQGAHLSSRVKIQSGQHRQATALEKIILVGVWTCLYYGPALPACCTELCTKPRTSCILSYSPTLADLEFINSKVPAPLYQRANPVLSPSVLPTACLLFVLRGITWS